MVDGMDHVTIVQFCWLREMFKEFLIKEADGEALVAVFNLHFVHLGSEICREIIVFGRLPEHNLI